MVDHFLSAKAWPVPILGALIPDGLYSSTMVLVEYDPEGQWLALSRSMVAQRVRNGLRVLYGAMARSREDVIASLTKLGVDVDAAEEAGLLRIDDYYTSTLSQDRDNHSVAIDDKYLREGSPKIADWSIEQSKMIKGQMPRLSKWGSAQPDVMSFADTFSPFLRFNDEKVFLEWIETRNLPLNRSLGRVNFIGISRGVHSESLYSRLEGALDGVIEIRAMERGDEIKNMLRIRNLKGQPHDARWHEIKVDSRGEASVVS